MLPTGNKTDQVIHQKYHRCIGKAGDVFMANYMNAHFIAPNTRGDIRYAVYFRVKGPAWVVQKHNYHESMLDPWRNWKL